MAQQTTAEQLTEMVAARAAQGPVGLLLDYDGTVADIRARPDLAHLPEEARVQLEQLARLSRVRLAIVTGRSREGLLSVSGPINGATLAVNGGLQVFSDGEAWTNPEADAARHRIHAAVQELRVVLARWPGTLIEDKELTLSVHYRQNQAARDELEATASRIVEAAQGALRKIPGKESFEIQPAIEWDKGRATELLMQRWGTGSRSLFLGDDRIDEPAFSATRALGGLACRVGAHHESTEAEWTLPTPADVRRMLGLLYEALKS